MNDSKRSPSLPSPASAAEDEAAAGIEGALGEYVEKLEARPVPARPISAGAPPEAGPDSALGHALASYLDSSSEVAVVPVVAARPAGSYTVRDVGVILAVFAASMLLLGAEGLLNWARRMDLGRVQDAWIAVLTPIYRATDAVGFTAPRRAAATASAQLARVLGAGQDPLFEEAWQKIGEIPVEPFDDDFDAWSDLAADEDPARLAVAKQGQVTVLLIGYSMMAGSLGAALENALSRNPRIRVVRAHQIGTGLARPELFDWMGLVAPLVEREKPQLIICSLGANDGQRIRHRGDLLAFGDASWNAVYRKRVRAMMQTLAGSDARVLWLGLPPMRSEGFTRRVRHLNRLFASTAKRVARVDYMELGMLLTGRDDGFTTFIRDDDGRLLRVRMEDGVHYSPAGARRVSRWVVDWVYEQLRRRRAVSG